MVNICGEKYVQGNELQFMYRRAFGKRSCERCTKSLRKINYGNEGIVCEGRLCLFILSVTMYSNRNLCAFFVVMKVDFAHRLKEGEI